MMAFSWFVLGALASAVPFLAIGYTIGYRNARIFRAPVGKDRPGGDPTNFYGRWDQ